MVQEVHSAGKINNISIILKKLELSDVKVNSSFGDGYANSDVNPGEFKRTIPGLNELLTKYNFDPPKYHKNIAQLTISDRDYIPDGKFEENVLQEA